MAETSITDYLRGYIFFKVSIICSGDSPNSLNI
jgi:hypothetical protein